MDRLVLYAPSRGRRRLVEFVMAVDGERVCTGCLLKTEIGSFAYSHIEGVLVTSYIYIYLYERTLGGKSVLFRRPSKEFIKS